MNASTLSATSVPASIAHTHDFKFRRFLNWFPLGLAYALLYMGRYNLTVAKTALGSIMTKEDFGIIFMTGTWVYAVAFLFNAPFVDRKGGRTGMLIALAGSAVTNLAMGTYLKHVLASPTPDAFPLRTVFSILYGFNMFFQGFAAVSIVKVNASWFHVRERGGFSGIFGTMISFGIFLAFTVNGWFLELGQKWFPGQPSAWVVFIIPAIFLVGVFLVELVLLRDRPSQAGHADFDTLDASSGEDDKPIPVFQLLKRIFTHPVLQVIALIEFCTGVLRNGVMQWFPIYAKEVWVLPSSHWLMLGKWDSVPFSIALIAIAALTGLLAKKAKGRLRIALISLAVSTFVVPFFQGGWGGLLFIAGVLGGNIAGFVSDYVFQSRRGPSAALLYGLLTVSIAGMYFVLANPTNTVSTAAPESGLQPGDQIVMIAGRENLQTWQEVGQAVACFTPTCKASQWNEKECMCTSNLKGEAPSTLAPSTGTIPTRIIRGGQTLDIAIKDPMPVQRGGDKRLLKATPVLPLSPFFLGMMLYFVSLAVIGTHGLLSGTATMDFGGRKAAATAVGLIDGCVYLGTGLQSVALGYLTTKNWSYWPCFLVPFSIAGFLLCIRIWNAKPTPRGSH